jgi:hypothetical protein
LGPAGIAREGGSVEGFDPATSFGPDVAQRYDNDLRGDEAETVEFLVGLAKQGPALQLAIGTGRREPFTAGSARHISVYAR